MTIEKYVILSRLQLHWADKTHCSWEFLKTDSSSVVAYFYILHSFQTTNTTQTLCSVWGMNSWIVSSCRKKSLERESWRERRGLSCLLHFRCVWSESVTKTPFTTHVKKGFIWSLQRHGAPSVPAQKYCSWESGKQALMFPLHFSQTNGWHLPSCTPNTAPWTPLKEYLWLSQVILVWGCLKGWREGRRPPKIGCLFISYVQRFRHRSLYLNLYIYFSWAVCMKWDVALSQTITRNFKDIRMSVRFV